MKLKELAGSSNILSDSRMASWQSINYQPGVGFENLPYHKDHICPHFDVICMAAALLGIARETILNKEEFCGRYLSHDHRYRIPDTPTSECERIALDLLALIQRTEPAVKHPVKARPDGKVHIVINCTPEELGGKLLSLMDCHCGKKPLDELSQRLSKLNPEKDFTNNPRLTLRETKKIYRALSRACFGILDYNPADFNQMIQIRLSSPQEKPKGCPLRPRQ